MPFWVENQDRNVTVLISGFEIERISDKIWNINGCAAGKWIILGSYSTYLLAKEEYESLITSAKSSSPSSYQTFYSLLIE
jgi:hypothetical protein